MVLNTPLGSSQVLAHPGGDRLYLLNESAADLWHWHQVSKDPQSERPLILKLMVDYGLSEADAIQQVDELLRHWRQHGLLNDGFLGEGFWSEQHKPSAFMLNEAQDWVISPPFLDVTGPISFTLLMAGVSFGVWVEHPHLNEQLQILLSKALLDSPALSKRKGRLAHQLALTGNVNQWKLFVNGQQLATGQGIENALTRVLHTLIDLACQAEERLLVVHGAGLKLANQRGLLLIAPGGSGKTTLATALNANGYGLLSDDVVPVTLDGQLLALNTPICVKSGSWEVLARLRPDIATASEMQRYGQSIRYLPPLGQACTEPLALGILIFPHYQPDAVALVTELSPEVALQQIIEADAVLRNLSQTKLDSLAQWVSSVPAYAISYPNLKEALQLVQILVAHLSENPVLAANYIG